MAIKYLTVTNINKYLNSRMKVDDNLNDVYIRGELSNVTEYPSNHTYFSLKDKESSLPGVLFAGYKRNCDVELKNGMNVLIHGQIEMYEKMGKCQLVARSVKEDGIGELYVAYEKLKKKLKEEGLFNEEHKKKIPKYPKRVGVVTAKTGSVVRDVITTIKRRYPSCEILVFSTLVQGDLAKYNIVEQIKRAQNYNLDTLIVGRGGGSIEDLWAFNEEMVARAIYESEVPVISAVGHETDYTISDLTADKRAATPTAAAEFSVPDTTELKNKLEQYRIRIEQNINFKLSNNRRKLKNISDKPLFKNPETIYNYNRMHLDTLLSKFDSLSGKIISENKNKLLQLKNATVLKKPEIIIQNKKEKYNRNYDKLEVLNPMLTLKRGYTITKKNDKVISSSRDVESDDELDIKFDDGDIHVKVI